MSSESATQLTENLEAEPETGGDDEGESTELADFIAKYSDNDDGDNGESENDDDKVEAKLPKDLKGLAETLKLDSKDLYKVEIPSAKEGEKPYTLGHLKDLAAEHDQFKLDQLKFDDSRKRAANALLKQQQELKILMDGLPKDAISESVLKRVREKRGEYLSAERTATLGIIEDWQDESKEKADRKEMREHLVEFGFPEDFLDSIAEHKTLRYIRENMLRERRLREVLGKTSERKAKSLGTGSKKASGKRRSQTRSNSEDGKVSGFLSAIS